MLGRRGLAHERDSGRIGHTSSFAFSCHRLTWLSLKLQLDLTLDFDFDFSPAFTIGRVAHLMRNAISAAVKDAGIALSPEETQVLIRLSSSDHELRMTELAERMMRDATTLTRQVDGLVRKKIVQRTVSPNDRRVILVAITDEGKKAVKELLPVLDRVRKKAMQDIAPENAEILNKALLQMKDNLSAN